MEKYANLHYLHTPRHTHARVHIIQTRLPREDDDQPATAHPSMGRGGLCVFADGEKKANRDRDPHSKTVGGHAKTGRRYTPTHKHTGTHTHLSFSPSPAPPRTVNENIFASSFSRTLLNPPPSSPPLGLCVSLAENHTHRAFDGDFRCGLCTHSHAHTHMLDHHHLHTQRNREKERERADRRTSSVFAPLSSLLCRVVL